MSSLHISLSILFMQVKMITGDHLLIAKETAKMLNMGTTMYPSEILIKAQNGDKESLHGYSTLLEMCEACNGFAEVREEQLFKLS
jgi:H+-transporting ATPase